MGGTAITVYLLWQLVSGVPKDVDSFMTKDECESVQVQLEGMVANAIKQTQREDLKQISFIGCQPVKVKPATKL